MFGIAPGYSTFIDTLLSVFSLVVILCVAFHQFLTFHCLKCISCNADIIIPPQAVNVSINGVAEFSCTGVANSFVWEINGEQVDDNGETFVVMTVRLNETQLNVRKSTLIMTMSSTDTAANITCTAISWLSNPITTAESDPALLLVQGM